jgi:putative membrane protein (TIGR04086 family)
MFTRCGRISTDVPDAAIRASQGDMMNIRWMAVLTGFVVDTLISFGLYAFAPAEMLTAPDITRPTDLILICLLVLSTGVGGYVAGRMAQTNRALHGLLVGIVGVLIEQLQLAAGAGPPMTRLAVIALATGCLAGALGGLLSHYPALNSPRQSGRG